MGACLSCKSSSTLKNVRVVHLNGYVEDFEQPISVTQVIGNGNPPKHFVCTSIQLLSSSSKSLKGDTQLQPGQVYFMLPYSVLQADVSPVDLTSLAKRLTSIAKTRPREYNKSLTVKASQTIWSSPSKSPGRVGVAEQIGVNMMMNGGGRSPCRIQPWKPILDTITEKPLNRRSESDLQESNECLQDLVSRSVY
ncbi:hypothetical protein SESBI_05980 [Sesbania bispinosa]|nr:hypothetical protein SESBI_05980 [Sesbania bispinosa]